MFFGFSMILLIFLLGNYILRAYFGWMVSGEVRRFNLGNLVQFRFFGIRVRIVDFMLV